MDESIKMIEEMRDLLDQSSSRIDKEYREMTQRVIDIERSLREFESKEVMTDDKIQQIIDRCGGNFRPTEFLDGRNQLKREIIEQIVLWRNWTGYSFEITSAMRETGSHYTGLCIDGYVWDKWKQSQPSVKELWLLATTWPFRRVGIYFDTNQGVMLHLDMIKTQRQSPLRWIRDKNYYYQSPIDGKFYTKSGVSYGGSTRGIR